MFTRSNSSASLPDLIQQLGGQAGVRSRLFAVPEALAEVLPDAGLRAGSAYSLDGPGALLLALLAEPSKEGAWCAAVGLPELGAEAAREAGASMDRLVLVPDPGRRWLPVVAALAEVMGVIAVRPSGSVSPADATRLASRLRDREATLLVVGEWPRAEATLRVQNSCWSGVGIGHGHLEGREATVSVTSKRHPMPRTTRLLLPGPDGRLGPLISRPAAQVPAERRLRAVG